MKKCIVLSIILFVLGIGYSFLPNDIIAGGELFGMNFLTQSIEIKQKLELLKTFYTLVLVVFSIILGVLAFVYSRDYKKEFNKSPNGYGLMIIGSILNLFGLFIGTLIIGIGAFMALFNKNRVNK